jgi:hypothetical protein
MEPMLKFFMSVSVAVVPDFVNFTIGRQVVPHCRLCEMA